MAILQYVVLEINSQLYNVLKKWSIFYQDTVNSGVYSLYNMELQILNNN